MPEPGTRGGRADLTRPVRVHVVGVGGAGMSALALALAGMGHEVTGSDVKDTAILDRLRAAGVSVLLGHEPGRVVNADVVTYSTAVPETNVELMAANRSGLQVLHRAEMLASVSMTRRTVAVGGTHGKTTSASMLALIMADAGWKPSFIIGGELNEVGTGAVWDSGEWLVLEADESDGSFLELAPEVAMVTSLERDHLDWYGSFEALTQAFGRFVGSATGWSLVSADDPRAKALGGRYGAQTFGTSADADYRIEDLETGPAGIAFSLTGRETLQLSLAVPGRHNAYNAAAASAVALGLGCEPAVCVRALARFAGVARRFEARGEAGGISFVDDYAHLPAEVSAALDTAGDGGWSRVVCVFQPHRYSRTAMLWRQFADAFIGADVVVVTDVYPAGESPRPGVSGRLIAEAVTAAHPEADVRYWASRPELLAGLGDLLRPGDLCLTLGAGDLTSLPDEVRTAT